VTWALLIGSWLFFLAPKNLLLYPLMESDNNLLLLWIFHPIIHVGFPHILGNTIGLLFIGTLIEKWMSARLRFRYLTFAMCYLISLAVWYVLVIFRSSERIALVGLSALLYSGLPFLLFNYLRSSDPVQVEGERKLVPIGIGFMMASLLLPVLSRRAYSSYINIDLSMEAHLFAFSLAFDVSACSFLIERMRNRYFSDLSIRVLLKRFLKHGTLHEEQSH